jgi:hypothetical protein
MPLTLLDGLQPRKANGADFRYLWAGSSTRVLLHTMCTQVEIFGPLDRPREVAQLIHELA